MSIPVTPNDPRVWIFVEDTWINVTLKVRQSDNGVIFIQSGNDDEALGDEINPGLCTFTLENTDGRFTPDNPNSPYYPHLGINTPVCVGLDEIRDYFSRTASNTWANSSTGETYQTKSINGVISATDYSTDGNYGIHSVPAALAARMSYLGSTSRAPLAYNVVQKVRYTPTFSDVTGGQIEPANLVCRLLSDTQFYMLRAVATTTESITLTLLKDDVTVLAGPITVSGITHTSGQPIWFALGAFDNSLYATAWQGDDIEDEPTDWLISADDGTYGYGYYGIRSGVGSGNTNTKPVQFKYDYYTVYTSEFNGEIPNFPQEFSDDGSDMIVPVTAGGVLRRPAETNNKLKSSMRRFYEKQPALFAPDYYWPLDDGELSTEGTPSIGQIQAVFHFNFTLSVDTSTEKHFGQGKVAPWLPNGVEVLHGSGTEFLQAYIPPGDGVCAGDFWTIQWVRTGGSGTADTFNISGYLDSGVTIAGVGVDGWVVNCDSFDEEITVSPGLLEANVIIDATTLPTNVFDGSAHIFRWRANAAGANINWTLYVDDSLAGSGTLLGHPFLNSLGAIYMTNASGGTIGTPIPATDNTTFSHVAFYVTNDINDGGEAYDQFLGSPGETAQIRQRRVCAEEDFPYFTNTALGITMGPQYDDSLFEILEEIVRTDGGMVREVFSGRGIDYITLEQLRAKTVVLTLDVGDETIAKGGFRPVRDSQRLRNRITAKRRSGAQYTYEKSTGRMGTADPKDGGSGVYDGGDFSVNCETDSQLVSIAEREVAEGTVDRARYPEVVVDIMSDRIKNDLTLRRQVLSVYMSSRIKLTNMDRWHIYDDADLLVIGYKRTLSPYTHMITWNTIPFDSLDIFHVETAGSILGTDSSTIYEAIDNDDTALKITTEGQSLWTTSAGSMPILAKIEGEEISISSISTPTVAFRSVGAASHGDNATTTPGLPAGHASGDTFILVSAIRNTAAVANVPAGYSNHSSFPHIVVASKARGSSESVPNCTYSGGAAGDTTSSFIIAIQNGGYADWLDALSNSSAQNIIFPSGHCPRSNGIQIYIGWKQDDYTSVAPPTALTEIIEASTTTGNDQSLYAAYRLMSYATDTQQDSFVVTGGASAISKGFVLHLSTPQNATVTRSVNGVVKSHSAGAEIRIAHPKVLG